MDKKEKVILVNGATGQQGGAVSRHLLKDGWKVRAFVRDENKPAALELQKLGAELFKGDLGNIESIENAMEGVYGVFSVQNFYEYGYDGELKQGISLAEAALKTGVKHFLQTSVGGAERETKIPHFDVKFEIEEYIRKINIPYTIIRPVFFMENFNTWFKPAEMEGKLVINMVMKKETKLQMIAVDDIGGIATVIFNNPEIYLGKEIEIAGDELTIPEVAEIYSKHLNRETVFNELPYDVLKANSEDLALMFQWFIDRGYTSDISKLKKMYPGLTSFEQWLKK